MAEPGTFRTRNLSLAAYLQMRKFSHRLAITDNEKVPDGNPYTPKYIVWFVYEQSHSLETAVSTYDSGRARVDPRLYANAIQRTRQIMRRALEDVEET